jgi:hypothetical protein
MRVSRKKSAEGLTSEFIATCSAHLLTALLDVFICRLFPLKIRVNEFTAIREGRKRLAKALQRLTAHDAISRGKPDVDEMLEEGVQSRQEFVFTYAVPQSKYATKADQ